MSEYNKMDTVDDRNCLECGNVLPYNRPGKKFCSVQCKNKFHNRERHHAEYARNRIISILDKNYKLLDLLIHKGIDSIDVVELSMMGYNINYATSYHLVRGRNEYRCFDIKFCCSRGRIYDIGRDIVI